MPSGTAHRSIPPARFARSTDGARLAYSESGTGPETTIKVGMCAYRQFFASQIIATGSQEQHRWFNELQRIFDQLGVRSRSRTIVLAREAGLGRG